MKQPLTLLIILAIITLLTACREATVAGSGKVETATPQAKATPINTSIVAAGQSVVTSTTQPNKVIGGYVFETPEVITNTYAHSIQILGQVPGEKDEIVVTRDGNLEILNIETGEVSRFLEDVTTNELCGEPVWIPDQEALAIVIDPEDSGNYELWFSYADETSPPKQITTNIISGIAQTLDKQGLLSLTQGQSLREINTMTLESQDKPLSFIGSMLFQTNLLQVAANPVTSWLAYYNMEGLFLVNSDTGEVRMIDLGSQGEERYWVVKAQWSPDGKQLGLLTTAGNKPLSFIDLRIYDLATDTVRALQDSFQIVNDFTWTPNSHQLVMSAVIGKKIYQISGTEEGFESNASALFLVGVFTEEILSLPLLPEEIASSGEGILWSLDGQYLVTWYREFKGSIGLYKIDVSS